MNLKLMMIDRVKECIGTILVLPEKVDALDGSSRNGLMLSICTILRPETDRTNDLHFVWSYNESVKEIKNLHGNMTWFLESIIATYVWSGGQAKLDVERAKIRVHSSGNCRCLLAEVMTLELPRLRRYSLSLAIRMRNLFSLFHAAVLGLQEAGIIGGIEWLTPKIPLTAHFGKRKRQANGSR